MSSIRGDVASTPIDDCLVTSYYGRITSDHRREGGTPTPWISIDSFVVMATGAQPCPGQTRVPTAPLLLLLNFVVVQVIISHG
jgi:hypothetical protein